MRTVTLLLIIFAACEKAGTRAVSTAELPPRRLAQVNLGTAPPEDGSVFWCLQDDAGRVRLTGILRARVYARPATTLADTVLLVETPRRTVDCKNRADGQPPRALEPRSLIEVRGSGAAVRAFVGDTVTVFGEAPAREALLDPNPLSMRFDSMVVQRGGMRIRVGPDGGSRP